jgi:hypothetical protein
MEEGVEVLIVGPQHPLDNMEMIQSLRHIIIQTQVDI